MVIKGSLGVTTASRPKSAFVKFEHVPRQSELIFISTLLSECNIVNFTIDKRWNGNVAQIILFLPLLDLVNEKSCIIMINCAAM